jgi:HEAT repeat protein
VTLSPEEEALRDAEDAAVAEALRFAGLKVSSVYDLVNTRASYSDAIPVLLRLLPDLKHHIIREGVVRALTVKDARGTAVDPLIVEFMKIPFEGDDRDAEQLLKWTIGNALRVTATKDDLHKLIELARDRRHGSARQEIVSALGRFRRPEAIEALLDALEDERVAGHAMSALKTLKASEAIPKIRNYLTHSSPWLRKVAKKTIERLEETRAEEPVGRRR